jgi:trimeric autotransporter adhesin
MSTKTTFKRVALVTVAALGFGVLSLVPSSATSQTDTLTLGSATTTSAGSALTNTITQSFLGVSSDTMSVSATLTSAPTGSVAMPILTTSQAGLVGTSGVSTDSLTGVTTDTGSVTVYSSATATFKVAFTPTVPGVYVVKFTAYNQNAGTVIATPIAGRSTTQLAAAAAVTWTVTVASGTVPDTTSTSVLSKGIVVSSGSGSGVDQSVVVAANTGSAVAVIQVTPLNAGAAITGSATTVATITSGPGSLSINTSAATATPNGARTVTQTGVGAAYIYLYGDGTTGTSTITITQGINTFTETVVFYGAAASVTSTLLVPVINSGSGAVSTGSVISATVKDAAGNVVPGVALFAVSSSGSAMASATATTGSAGVAYFSFTGLVAGTSAITVQSFAAGSTAGTTDYSAAALSVRAGSNVTSSAVLSLDKATYSQGEAAVLTVTLKDAAGNAVADGTHTPFTAAVSSRALTGTGTLPGDSLVTAGSNLGVLTYKINVPNTSGNFTISATAGSGYTGTFSVTATVSASAAEVAAADAIAAAADAAAEATDAANAATDAANAAAEAADAATAAAQDAADAVAALSTQVADLIAGLTAQISAQKAAITALTNLVIKIQKKVKA